MGRSIELLHMLNVNTMVIRYNDKTNVNLHVFFLFRQVETRCTFS